jgi:hypothetical protein
MSWAENLEIKTRDKNYNRYSLTADLTSGKIMAIKNALQLYVEKTGSPVAEDVLGLLIPAINKNEDLLKIMSRE